MAQSTTGNGSCITLAANNICGPTFEGMPVRASEFNSTEIFNQQLETNFGDPANIAVQFKDVFKCTEEAVRPVVTSLRFQVSYACSRAVIDAVKDGCAVATKKVPALCNAQCLMSAATLERVIRNSTYCPAGNQTETTKELVLKSMVETCGMGSDIQSQNENGFCSTGTRAEAANCGWKTFDLAKTECAKLTNDSCCSKLLTPSSASLSPGIIAAIVILALLVLVGIAMLIYMQLRKSYGSESTSPTYQKDPFESAKIPNYNPNIRPTSYITGGSGTLNTNRQSFLMGGGNQNKTSALSGLSTGTPFNAYKLVVVTHVYESTLQDELDLQVGDKVYIIKEFDDGWALGVHKDTEREGAFPLVCTEDVSEAANRLTLPVDTDMDWEQGASSNKDVRISKRVSSVYWEKESRASSVNPFFGRNSPAPSDSRPSGKGNRNNAREAGLSLPSDDYYGELDLDLPDRR
jgi:hypothetical protein